MTLLNYTTSDAHNAAAAAALVLSNDCGPCCECIDFVNTYKGLAKLNSMYYALGVIAQATRDTHKDNIARWTDGVDCRTGAQILLLTQPEPGCFLYVAGSVINLTGGCIRPLIITVAFTTVDLGAGEIICRECYRSGSDTKYAEKLFTPIGAYPSVSIYYEFADINSISKIQDAG